VRINFLRKAFSRQTGVRERNNPAGENEKTGLKVDGKILLRVDIRADLFHFT
jgi:hypothetical protein